MSAILLVGTWVYADSPAGDFLAMGTWLLGPRIGFEPGIIANGHGDGTGSIGRFCPGYASRWRRRGSRGGFTGSCPPQGFSSAMRSGGQKRALNSLRCGVLAGERSARAFPVSF